MVQRTRSTEYDPKFPWLNTLPWMGAEDPPEGDKPKDDGTDPNAGGAGGTGDKPDPADQGKGTVDLAEYEAVKVRMQAADRAKTEAEKKLRDLEDKDKGELEVARRDLEEAKAAAAKAAEDAKQLRIHNAFLTDNTFDWVNPAAALRLVDLEGVEIDENGKVKGLARALEKLSKSDPYLLKAKADGGDGKDGKDGKGGAGGGQASGSGRDGKNPPGGKDAGNAGRLAETFPVLRSRIRT